MDGVASSRRAHRARPARASTPATPDTPAASARSPHPPPPSPGARTPCRPPACRSGRRRTRHRSGSSSPRGRGSALEQSRRLPTQRLIRRRQQREAAAVVAADVDQRVVTADSARSEELLDPRPRIVPRRPSSRTGPPADRSRPSAREASIGEACAEVRDVTVFPTPPFWLSTAIVTMVPPSGSFDTDVGHRRRCSTWNNWGRPRRCLPRASRRRLRN